MVVLPWTANWLMPLRLGLPTLLSWLLGGVVFCAGIAVWVRCLDSFIRQGRGTPFPLDAPSRLVTTGPFSVIRNPIIAAEVAVIWGEALFFASVGILIYAVLISLAAHLAVVYGEEPDLRRRFGDEYAEYCDRVPRWWPRRKFEA